MSFLNLGTIISDAANFINDQLPWNRRIDPQWLLSIQGDFPLLGRSEWEYIAEVRYRIIRQAERCPNIPSDHRLREKLSVVKNNFKQIASYLRQNSKCKNYFVNTYPSWRSVRDKSIIQLKDIANAVNVNRMESAVSRKNGSSVSLVGGLMCLVPGIGALRIAGTVLMGLGSLASLAASFVEMENFRKKIKEAEKIMLEDKRYSEKLWNWINDVSYMEEAYEVIKNMSIDLKRIAFDLHGFYKTEHTPKELKMFIALLSLKFPSEMIHELADVIAMLIATSMLYERYRPMFNVAFEAYKFKRILFRAGSVIASTACMTSIVNAGCKGSTLTTFQKSRIGIGMALDIITIMQACKDMESTSKEAIEIEKVAEKLKKEAENFKKLYDAVRSVSAG